MPAADSLVAFRRLWDGDFGHHCRLFEWRRLSLSLPKGELGRRALQVVLATVLLLLLVLGGLVRSIRVHLIGVVLRGCYRFYGEVVRREFVLERLALRGKVLALLHELAVPVGLLLLNVALVNYFVVATLPLWAHLLSRLGCSMLCLLAGLLFFVLLFYFVLLLQILEQVRRDVVEVGLHRRHDDNRLLALRTADRDVSRGVPGQD